MENITSQQIKDAIIRAKTDTNFAEQLKQRLETGKFDTQLSEIGLKRSPQGLVKISEVTVSETPIGYKDTGEDITQTGRGIANVAKETIGNIKESFAAQKAGEQTLGETIGQTVGQVAGGISGVGGEVVKGAVKAVLPQEAETAIKKGVATGVSKGIEVASDLIGKYEQLKQNKPVLAGALSIALGKTPDVALTAKDMIEGYQKIKETNPRMARNIDAALGVGQFALDVATLGGGKVAATAAKEGIEQGAKVAGKQIAKTAGEVGAGVAKGARAVGDVTAGARKVVSDIVPTKGEFMSGQISKALDLTQGDLSNIKLATGNDVGDFIARNNLIGGTKKETIDAIKTLTDSQYKTVRDEIGKVTKIYAEVEIPKVKQSIKLLEKQVKDVPGLEDTYKEVSKLAKKTKYELKDVQRVKELLDEQFNLFKATGDVKEGTIKKGLANNRKALKEFIEKEVKDTTGADIAIMNNDVATGKGIMQLANKRATREFTRANVSLSDLGAFGGASMVGTPLAGMAAVAVKRIIETPTIRLRIAKMLNSLPKATQKAVQSELLDGKVPKVIENAMQDYRLATNIKKKTPSITKKASIPKASTKLDNKSTKLSTGSLESEANKYKSAEEFVKAQGTPVYHGGDTINKVELKPNSVAARGNAFYVSPNINVSKKYGKNINELFFSKNANIVEGSSLAPQSIVEDFNRTFPSVLSKDNYTFDQMISAIKADKYFGNEDAVGKFFTKNKIDGIRGKMLYGGNEEIAIYNPEIVKTKSQLTDIWKKANKK